jgi:uncharacterized protein
MHYLLFYEAADDYLDRRAAFRDEHLKLAWQAQERGELILGGAFANPVDGAAILFQGASPAAAERFAQADPYVANGLVKRWYVREWTTVAGDLAATPIRPQPSVKSPSERGERPDDRRDTGMAPLEYPTFAALRAEARVASSVWRVCLVMARSLMGQSSAASLAGAAWDDFRWAGYIFVPILIQAPIRGAKKTHAENKK